MRPWNFIEIEDCGEPLVPISEFFYCLEPHPYLSIGAPYGKNNSPWLLRSGVLGRLLIAQSYLNFEQSGLKLAIFDSCRHIAVQLFMIEYSIKKECSLRGINMDDHSNFDRLQEVIEDVNKFWAPPIFDPSMPPPHSTGAAVDLTISDLNGETLDMGGEIDFIGDISLPNYYQNTDSLFNSRRSLLFRVMNKAGFSQHPNEWWHFSFGDQLWGWDTNSKKAIYGAALPSNNAETL